MCNRYASPHEAKFLSAGTIFMTPQHTIFFLGKSLPT